MADAAPAIASAIADAHARMGMADRHRLAVVGLVAAAGLALGGCGPSRTAPDQSLRIEPAKSEPTATIAIDIKAERPSPDSAGKAAGGFVASMIPLVSAVAPSYGADGLAASSASSAIVAEVRRSNAAKVVTDQGQADYILSGSTESRSQMRMHCLGLGIGYYVGLLPVAFGLPSRSYAADVGADVELRRRDGTRLFSRSFSSDQSWWTGSWSDGPTNNFPVAMSVAQSVGAPEVGMQVAADVAKAISADQASQPKPAASAQ